MKNKKAFTLVEALVVVAIIGIMVTVTVPAISRFVAMYKFRTNMNQIVIDIRSARQAAITNGRPVKITFIPMTEYPEVAGMRTASALYMLNSTDEAAMDDQFNWLEIAPNQTPCGGRAERPRFMPSPIEVDPAESTLFDVESVNTDGIIDLVFRGNGAVFEGPYPRGNNSGERLVFNDTIVAGKEDELSPGFTMKTVSKTAFDRYVIYLSLFGKVSVHPYHS
jgi:prepilin-type N-terminal cleavage/methylation domain-containing protein